MRRRWDLRSGGGAAGLAALAMALLAPAAAAQSVSPVALRADAQAGRTNLLASYYKSGVTRLGAGDPAGARVVFETTSAIAPGIPELQAALAAAIVFADFATRERALAPIRAATAADPDEPLYRVIAVLADPALSRLDPDGALSLTAAGAAAIAEATPRLAGARGAYNAKYLALLLATQTASGLPEFPERIPGFAAMLGPGRGVTLPRLAEPVSLGRLFELSVPDAAFKPYEAAFVDRLLAAAQR